MTWIVVKGCDKLWSLTRSYRLSMNGPFSVCYQRTSRPVYHEIHVQTICPIFYMLHHEKLHHLTQYHPWCPVSAWLYRSFIFLPWITDASVRALLPGIFSNFNDGSDVEVEMHLDAVVGIGWSIRVVRTWRHEVHVQWFIQRPVAVWYLYHVSVVQLGGSRQLLWFVCVNEDPITFPLWCTNDFLVWTHEGSCGESLQLPRRMGMLKEVWDIYWLSA
jgi:hypothetical protein